MTDNKQNDPTTVEDDPRVIAGSLDLVDVTKTYAAGAAHPRKPSTASASTSRPGPSRPSSAPRAAARPPRCA